MRKEGFKERIVFVGITIRIYDVFSVFRRAGEPLRSLPRELGRGASQTNLILGTILLVPDLTWSHLRLMW